MFPISHKFFKQSDTSGVLCLEGLFPGFEECLPDGRDCGVSLIHSFHVGLGLFVLGKGALVQVSLLSMPKLCVRGCGG